MIGGRGLIAIVRVLGWLAIAALAVLSLVPGAMRPHVVSSNHAEHFAAYAGTAALLVLGYRGRIRPLWLGLALMLYAGVLETLQIWVPFRGAKLSDFLVSAAAVWVGVLAVLLAVSLGRRA